jgi:hypothetical protein
LNHYDYKIGDRVRARTLLRGFVDQGTVLVVVDVLDDPAQTIAVEPEKDVEHRGSFLVGPNEIEPIT